MQSRPALPLRAETLEHLSAQVPEWAAASRRQGLQYFEKLEMPQSAEEVWRYVDLPFDLKALELAPTPGAGMAEVDEIAMALGSTAGHATIVDGTVTDLQVSGNEAFLGWCAAGSKAFAR